MLTPFRQDLSLDLPAVDALTDWYLDNGAQGLFAVCLSSEMYHLNEEERLTLAGRVARRAAGRAPVIAAGVFGGSLQSQAQFTRRLAEAGVAAVVLVVNQFAEADDPDAVWQAHVAEFLDQTAAVPLGLYECPAPYHRRLSVELLSWAARTGRFVWMKDTCCDAEAERAKIAAVHGTPLRWFNAHVPTLLSSLQAGGDGYSGTAANLYPELFAWLCRNYAAYPPEAAALQRLLTLWDVVIRPRYPQSAKVFLQRRGLPLSDACRVSVAAASPPGEEQLVHDCLLAELAEVKSRLPAGVPSTLQEVG